MWTEADILSAVAGLLARTGESEAGFGRRIAGDPNLIGDIRRGRSPRLRMARQIMTACELEAIHESAGANQQ